MLIFSRVRSLIHGETTDHTRLKRKGALITRIRHDRST